MKDLDWFKKQYPAVWDWHVKLRHTLNKPQRTVLLVCRSGEGSVFLWPYARLLTLPRGSCVVSALSSLDAPGI